MKVKSIKQLRKLVLNCNNSELKHLYDELLTVYKEDLLAFADSAGVKVSVRQPKKVICTQLLLMAREKRAKQPAPRPRPRLPPLPLRTRRRSRVRSRSRSRSRQRPRLPTLPKPTREGNHHRETSAYMAATKKKMNKFDVYEANQIGQFCDIVLDHVKAHQKRCKDQECRETYKELRSATTKFRAAMKRLVNCVGDDCPNQRAAQDKIQAAAQTCRLVSDQVHKAARKRAGLKTQQVRLAVQDRPFTLPPKVPPLPRGT